MVHTLSPTPRPDISAVIGAYKYLKILYSARKPYDTFLNAYHIRPHIKRISQTSATLTYSKELRSASENPFPHRSSERPKDLSFHFRGNTAISTYRRFYGNISFQKHPLCRIHIINLFFRVRCLSWVRSVKIHILSFFTEHSLLGKKLECQYTTFCFPSLAPFQ
ncbi:hypothetical protein CEXT_353741 [Caerostris extrusa]|uniref:Uncharacterized protein n=1 Tax=Caerostris extrusa TaxID=172846 RepID=A0AAV4QS12_CAEEX|nr:hypothetical protein CEXT_353741 [Caerostris extrusa]